MSNILLPNLIFQQYELTQPIDLLSDSLRNMSKLTKTSLDDSKFFFDLGAAIEANFQKVNVDFSKFSMQTAEMILKF